MGLVMLRHTKPDVADGMCYGHLDLDVAACFERDALRLSQTLSTPDQIVSSPLQRCRKLADYLAGAWSLSVEVDHRLKEMDFGAWEGQLWDDIARSELDSWSDDFFHGNPHGGETVAQLAARVQDAKQAYLENPRNVLWVTHSGVIKAALAKGTQPDDYSANVSFGEFVSLP